MLKKMWKNFDKLENKATVRQNVKQFGMSKIHVGITRWNGY